MILNATKYRPLWTPALLTHPPSMWYNDTSTFTLTSSGQEISTVSDLSGNANTLSSSSAAHFMPANFLDSQLSMSSLNFKRVLWMYPGAPTNGFSVTYATGTAKPLTNNVAAAWWAGVFLKRNIGVGGSGSVTYFLWYASTNTSQSSRFAVSLDDPTQAGHLILRCRRLDADALARLSSATALNQYQWYVGMVVLDYTGRTGTIYLNGSQDAQNTTLVTSGNTSATNSADNVGLGNAGGAGSNAVDALTAENLFGVNLPSSAEIDKINGYLAWRWGLQANLPGGHAYKNNPPYA